MDVETLSENARAIFEKLKPFHPPDPWGNPRWKEEGIIIDNWTFDLRKAKDRARFEKKLQSFLGFHVKTNALLYQKTHGSLAGFEREPVGKLGEQNAEQLLILSDLCYQIETGDLCDP